MITSKSVAVYEMENGMKERISELEKSNQELRAEIFGLLRSEEAMRKSEEKYRLLFNSIDEGFCVIEKIENEVGKPLDFLYVEANTAFAALSGVGDIEGKTLRQSFPEEPEEWFDTYDTVLRTGEPIRFKRNLIIRGHVLEIFAFRVEDETHCRVAVIFKDITQRKNAEEALSESKARYKDSDIVQVEWGRLSNVLNMLPAYVILLSQDYRVPFANRFFEEHFGKSEDRRCYEYLFERTEPCKNCETYKVFKTGIPHHWEWTGPDNRNYDIYDYPFKDSDGSILIMEVGIDITEIKKAQAAVLAERQRLFDVLETLPAMICLLTPDYHIVFANRSFREKFGESCNRHCYEYCYGRTEPCEFCETYRVLETGQPHHWEINNQDGSVSDAYEFPFTDVDGSQMILEMSIDITERKFTEAELKKHREHLEELVREQTAELAENEKRFRTLAENSPDLIARFDRQNRHLYVNPASVEIYGYPQEKVIGKTHSELRRDPEQIKFWEEHHEKVFAKGKPDTMEFEYTSPQGKKHYFNTRIVPEFVDGRVASVLAISRDITGIKEAETRLKETLDNLEKLAEERTAELEKAYRSLKESEKGLAEAQKIAHLGNWNWNIVTNELYWSDEIYRIFGRSPQEFGATYDAFLSYVHPDDRECVNNAVKRALEGKTYSIDHRVILASGEERIVHEQGEVVFGDGNVPLRMNGIVQDITERKKAEKALELANAYNRSLIEASLDPLITIGPDGKIMDVNKATESVTGYSRKELIGTDFSNYFTEPEKAKAGYKQVFREGLVLDYALEIQHRNGHITPVLYNASVYRDEDGEIIGIFAAARDITEHKKAEKELKLANSYNRSLIEASIDPLVTIGPDGKITDVNNSTEYITGYSRKELIGTDFSDYFTEPDKAREGYQHVFQKGLVRDYPLEIRHKDGYITPVLYNASVYRNENGEVTGVFAAARDITELKKAEEKIRTLANVVESSNDAIIAESLDGIITSWNKGAEQVYGYSAEEVLGKNLSILEPDNLNGEIKQLADRVKHGKKVRGYETLRLKKDGTILNISVTLSPVFDVSGKLVAISNIAGDITEKKITENLLHEKEMAEIANRTKSEFLANMSHELRTPLNSIIGFSDMLHEKEYGELNRKQLRAVGNISNSGKHLLNLINGILDLSKIEAKKMELNYREFELATKLDLIRNVLYPIAEKKNIEIKTDIDRELTKIRADEEKFTRIMYNLVDNAIKFSYENSLVKIRARKKGDMVEITVQDDGVGIKAEDQHKLFKPFSQVDTFSSKKYQGTGLGLSLVKQIVNLHGGYVWFSSEHGEGSTFAFAIPIAAKVKVLAYCH